MMNLFELLKLSFNFSFHLVLNRNQAFHLLILSFKKVKIAKFMSKILKSNFSRDDLLKCYEMIYNQSYQMEEPNIDFNLPKKMNTLINFSNSQKAVSFLYSKYDLSFITTVVGKNTIEIKNDILISARKFKEVYI